MSTKPRTPRYFPKMKVRGARRRTLERRQRIERAFDRAGYSFDEFTRTVMARSLVAHALAKAIKNSQHTHAPHEIDATTTTPALAAVRDR